MPKFEQVKAFVKAVEEEPHDQVIQRFYADDAFIKENQLPPKGNKQQLIVMEQMIFSNAASVHSKCILPFFINENKVVIRWKFRFNWKNGTYSEIEEMAYQTWEDDKIKSEHFFFDPQQMIPKKEVKN